MGMRNVIALGFVSFFTDFSTEMILGILPLFIVTNLGAPKAVLGGIEGSAEIISYALIPGAIAVMILIFLVKEVVVIKRELSSTTAATTTTTAITTKIVSSFSKVLKQNRPFTLLIIISGII